MLKIQDVSEKPAASCPKTMANFYHIIWGHIPEEGFLLSHCHENLILHILKQATTDSSHIPTTPPFITHPNTRHYTTLAIEKAQSNHRMCEKCLLYILRACYNSGCIGNKQCTYRT